MGFLAESEEDWPCGNYELLVRLKRSQVYHTIRQRVAELLPIDSWQLGESHYFIFELKRPADKPVDHPVPAAFFEISWGQFDPTSALIVSLSANGSHVEVEDLIYKGPLQTFPVEQRAKQEAVSKE